MTNHPVPALFVNHIACVTDVRPVKPRASATGYGVFPTCYVIHFEGRWRRVYCIAYSNAGTLCLSRKRGESLTVVREY